MSHPPPPRRPSTRVWSVIVGRETGTEGPPTHLASPSSSFPQLCGCDSLIEKRVEVRDRGKLNDRGGVPVTVIVMLLSELCQKHLAGSARTKFHFWSKTGRKSSKEVHQRELYDIGSFLKWCEPRFGAH